MAEWKAEVLYNFDSTNEVELGLKVSGCACAPAPPSSAGYPSNKVTFSLVPLFLLFTRVHSMAERGYSYHSPDQRRRGMVRGGVRGSARPDPYEVCQEGESLSRHCMSLHLQRWSPQVGPTSSLVAVPLVMGGSGTASEVAQSSHFLLASMLCRLASLV